MFNKLFVFSVIISAVAAELSPGLYRIHNPEINTAAFVAKSGGEIGVPVVLSLSQPSDLHELWVVRRASQGPANSYTLENIGQDQATYATDFNTDTENFVYTGVTDQHPYYIESPDDDDNYVIYADSDHAKAWTAPGQSETPISIEELGTAGQTWNFVPALA
ncbi:hypothetical protein M413DRAFT_440762 [Hebeloma cylindrosporum]|uniref:Ricin B lectin domain-containing protein n=1 Tax=Hebeloma cylindrosporum TaxID=76867 RepID=A0A0C3CTW3_HEBCY|nr:hypothetical protein M413DRAFT_440762 [Hebeloma cylindrosporum h7]